MHKYLCHAIALLCLSFGGAASAASIRAYTTRPVLDPLPKALDGLTVTLRQTLNPEIVLFNLTPEPLLIRGPNGHSFLRFDNRGVYANYATVMFHKSRYAEPRPLPSNAYGPARWHRLRPVQTWGWFDPRLRTTGDTGSAWRIPVQLGNQHAVISGHFVKTLAPQGVYRSVVTVQPTVEHTSVHSFIGARPGVFVHNRGSAQFDVRGENGERFLRFLPGKVLLNRSSPTWRAAAPADTKASYVPASGRSNSWTVVSATNGFGWADPRVQPAEKPPHASTPQRRKTWTIPIAIGGRTQMIKGYTEWLPADDHGLRAQTIP